MTHRPSYQHLKSRDDRSVVRLVRDDASVDESFTIPKGETCSWGRDQWNG